MDFISVSQVHFTYPGAQREAVSGVSFSAESGEYVALLGANGSGKSTLACLLCGFLPPSSGSISVPPDKDAPDTVPADGGSTVPSGMVFQSPRDQIVAGTVRLDTAFGPENIGLSSPQITERVYSALSLTELTEKAYEKTERLSAGQKQKLALAGILALHPRFLVLDEVTSMTDPESRTAILDFLDTFHEKGRTIIHVTHDMEEAMRASRVIVLYDGKKVFDGTAAALLSRPELGRWGLVSRVRELPARKESWRRDAPETGQNAASIHADRLFFSYTPGKPLFEDLSLTFETASLTAVMGKSGSGKSTLLELCAGVLQPQKGTVSCRLPERADTQQDGHTETSGRPVLAVQESESALFEEFVADDIAYGLSNRGAANSQIKSCVRRAMELVSLPFDEFADRRTQELSGGEKRKAALAGIIVLDSQAVFFDEPTSGLDPAGRSAVMETLVRLAVQGKTVVFSTHHEDEAACADRVIVLDGGRIASDTKPAEKGTDQMEALPPLPGVEKLDTLRSDALSSYRHLETPVHRLPPIWKYIVLIAFLVCGTAFNTPLLLGCVTAAGLLYAALARCPVKRLARSIVRMIPWLLFIFALQILLFPAKQGEPLLFSWYFITVTPSKIRSGVLIIMHFVALLIPVSVFTFSTEETEILYGMEDILSPLRVLGIPVQNAALVTGIVFRFIPLLSEEAARILKVQLIRGGAVKHKGLFKKIRSMLPLFVPLMIQTLRRAGALGEALDARYYGRGKRRRWIPPEQ